MCNWILRTVKDENVNVLLVCNEYDTYNYNYGYVSKIPDTVEELLALAVSGNYGTWLEDWYCNLKDEDNIYIFSEEGGYVFGSIKNKVNELLQELE